MPIALAILAIVFLVPIAIVVYGGIGLFKGYKFLKAYDEAYQKEKATERLKQQVLEKAKTPVAVVRGLVEQGLLYELDDKIEAILEHMLAKYESKRFSCQWNIENRTLTDQEIAGYATSLRSPQEAADHIIRFINWACEWEITVPSDSLYTVNEHYVGGYSDLEWKDSVSEYREEYEMFFGTRLTYPKYEQFAIPDDARFRHQWVVAPSGAGKTTLLQTQIVGDLYRVIDGECSVVVIDSQNVLIPKIAHLNLFARGQPLHGKLVLLEPDPDYPPALNVLDFGQAALSPRERFQMQAEALENIKSCLATMNDLQDDVLSYIVELAFAIPDATIQTLIDILKPNGLASYKQYLDDVDQTCRDFFEGTFLSSTSTSTKDSLLRRLLGMLRNPTFRRMFLNERNRFNMYRELAEPKVILINTDRAYLRHDACQLFGRFFIAQLLQAAEMRGSDSLPVFCYVDECHDYISNEPDAAELLDKARKRNVAMIFAHQRIANIESSDVRDALANVGVRFAGGNETDADYLSKIFRCEPEFIADMEVGTFAAYVRGMTKNRALQVHVPPDALERLETMSDKEFAAIHRDIRARYCLPAAPSARDMGRPTPAAETKMRRKRAPEDPTTASSDF